MGIRKTVLTTIKDILDGSPIVDEDGKGDGRLLTAVNKIFDTSVDPIRNLPKIAVVPAPHNIVTGLYGRHMDSTYRVAIYGYVSKPQNEEVLLAGEDVIDLITRKLTDWDNIEIMRQKRFSIIEIGPVLNEAATAGADVPLAYISMQLAIQFVEH